MMGEFVLVVEGEVEGEVGGEGGLCGVEGWGFRDGWLVGG